MFMQGFKATGLTKVPSDATHCQNHYAIREGQVPYFIQETGLNQFSHSPSQGQPREDQQTPTTSTVGYGVTSHPQWPNQPIATTENGRPNCYTCQQFSYIPCPNAPIQHQIHPGHFLPSDPNCPQLTQQRRSSQNQSESASLGASRGQSQSQYSKVFQTGNRHFVNTNGIPVFLHGTGPCKGLPMPPLTNQVITPIPPGFPFVSRCEKGPEGDYYGTDKANKWKSSRKSRNLLSAQKLLLNAQKLLFDACQKIMSIDSIEGHESQPCVPSYPPCGYTAKSSRRKRVPSRGPLLTQPPWDSNPKTARRKPKKKSDQPLMDIQAVVAQCVEQMVCAQLNGLCKRSVRKRRERGYPQRTNYYQHCDASSRDGKRNASQANPNRANVNEGDNGSEVKDPAAPTNPVENDSEEVLRLLQEIECVCNELCATGYDGETDKECSNVCKLMQLLTAESPSTQEKCSDTPPMSANQPYQKLPLKNNCCTDNQQTTNDDDTTLELMKVLMNAIAPARNCPRQRERPDRANQGGCRSRDAARNLRIACPSKGIPSHRSPRRVCSKTNNSLRRVLRHKPLGPPSNYGCPSDRSPYEQCFSR